ncbi:hypothetical protein M5C72_11180 [Companilactobacillus allii]|nr:hypothetical protein M5C72_11180 [Companilactobacillus allii]
MIAFALLVIEILKFNRKK